MTVQYHSDGHIRIVVIDRPEAANAINEETHARLRTVWDEFRADDDAWLGILTGSGTKAFSAGADLKEIDPKARAAAGGLKRPFGGITRDFDTDKPMIAAVNGVALGGGLEMALACDLRLAAEHARLGLTEANWALLPAGGGTQRLPRLVGPAVALEMMMTGEPIDAQRAYELGLVNRVTTADELMPTTLDLARAICANGPLAVRGIKQAVRRGLEMPLEHGLVYEREISIRLYGTADAAEGPAAFREKRPPRFIAG